MKRLAATLLLDVRLQGRNYLYPIGIGVAVATGLTARWLLDVAAVAAVLPGLWLSAVGSTTFMFMAGMILFEKGERTLDALVVTPLPLGSYLASKVTTLSTFALLESWIVLALAHGPTGVGYLPLVAGLAALGAIYGLAAVALALAHTTVNEFLVPSGIVAMTLLQVPALDAFGIWSHPLLYLFPTQAPVVLLKGAFDGLAAWEWVYGLGYAALSIAALTQLAKARFRRHVVEKGGGV